MSRILHITCDYGDRFEPAKTRAVRNLVEASDRFEHTVFSLNRSSLPTRGDEVHRDGNVYALRYFGLPAGLGLRFWLRRAAARLSDLVASEQLDVDIVHCHKLTFEGAIGRFIAREHACPYVCTVRGDTDLKVLRFKPTYRRWYRSILRDSDAVFFLAPWTQRVLGRMWPDALPERQVLLPNIVELPGTAGNGDVHSNRIVSVFHLKDLKRKNLSRLLDAVDDCRDQGTPVYLDIIGGGTGNQVNHVENLLQRQRHPDAFRLLGHLSHEDIAAQLPSYAALVLPSRRETFGMVYLEALLSGIPFLQSSNTGLDGYFDGHEVSVTVNPDSTSDIAAGIRFLLENGEQLRANVAQLRRSGDLEKFSRDRVVQTYAETITGVLAES